MMSGVVFVCLACLAVVTQPLHNVSNQYLVMNIFTHRGITINLHTGLNYPYTLFNIGHAFFSVKHVCNIMHLSWVVCQRKLSPKGCKFSKALPSIMSKTTWDIIFSHVESHARFCLLHKLDQFWVTVRFLPMYVPLRTHQGCPQGGI